MVNNGVNRAVYGGGTSGSVRYAGIDPQIRARTSVPMQSEVRNAYWQSGALPSDVPHGVRGAGPDGSGWADFLHQLQAVVPAVEQTSASGTGGECGLYAHGYGSIRLADRRSKRGDGFASAHRCTAGTAPGAVAGHDEYDRRSPSRHARIAGHDSVFGAVATNRTSSEALEGHPPACCCANMMKQDKTTLALRCRMMR